jgi:hypothetical protein
MKTHTIRLLSLVLLLGSPHIRAQDVTDFNLSKSLGYTQSTAGLPALLAVPFGFNASANTATGGLLGGTIATPLGSVLSLTADGPTSWSTGSTYLTSAALEAGYPGGSYVVKFHTAHDGDKKLTLSFATSTFPNAPQILNFQAAQAVVPTGDFTATWSAFNGGKTSDFVRLTVSTADGQIVFKTRGYGKSGALNGTSTATTIPAGTLAAGQIYSASILFARGIGQNTDYGQGVVGTTAYYTETVFPLVTVGTLGSPDVKRFGVLKGVNFRQTSPGAPVLVDGKPYVMNVFADSIDGGLLGGGLKLPSGTVQPFTVNNGDLGIYSTYLSQPGLDADYPPGNYTVALNTAHNGTQTILLPLPASTFPNAPQLVNYSAAQAVNPNADFLMSWNAFAGGSANDFVQVQIDVAGSDSSAFQSPQPGQPGALNGTSTSATIPANTLTSGQSYQVRLLFARFLGQSTTYSLGFSAYYSQTELTLVTTGTAVAPTLAISRSGPSQWLLHANGIIGRNYVIESTTSLTPAASWQPMVNFVGSPSGFDFSDGVVRTQNFYRVLPVN